MSSQPAPTTPPRTRRTLRTDPTRDRARSRAANATRPTVEGLESRVVLYDATGNAWPNPQLITISFMPDGTNVGEATPSNLFATFNARFGSPSVWENQILKAAQVWAQQTNINFAVVPDDGAAEASGADQQGDPEFGDIRIGGASMGMDGTLAEAYQPPPVNNGSLGGDIVFNTSYVYSINHGFDVFSVAAHEFGHALGLGHSTVNGIQEVMYPQYQQNSNLWPDDIAGIESIYSKGQPRSPDWYEADGYGTSISNALYINPLMSPSSPVLMVTGLNVATSSDVNYYKFSAPANTNGAMSITVQSSGLSLLSPEFVLYGSDGKTVINTTTAPAGSYGTTLTQSGFRGVAPGETFYLAVQGHNTWSDASQISDSPAFETGNYALIINFAYGSTASPVAPSPNTTKPNGAPFSIGGGDALSLAKTGPYSLARVEAADRHDTIIAAPVERTAQAKAAHVAAEHPGVGRAWARLVRPASSVRQTRRP